MASCRKFNLLNKRGRKNREKVQNHVGEKNQICRKQLKGQETGNISVVVVVLTLTRMSPWSQDGL